MWNKKLNLNNFQLGPIIKYKLNSNLSQDAYEHTTRMQLTTKSCVLEDII